MLPVIFYVAINENKRARLRPETKSIYLKKLRLKLCPNYCLTESSQKHIVCSSTQKDNATIFNPPCPQQEGHKEQSVCVFTTDLI